MTQNSRSARRSAIQPQEAEVLSFLWRTTAWEGNLRVAANIALFFIAGRLAPRSCRLAPRS